MRGMIEDIHGEEMPGVSRIYVCGEFEHYAEQVTLRDGVAPLEAVIWQRLEKIASDFGMEVELAAAIR